MRRRLTTLKGLGPLVGLALLAAGVLLGALSSRPTAVAPPVATARESPYQRLWWLVFGGIGFVATILFLASLVPHISRVLVLLFFSILLAAAVRPAAEAASRRAVPGLGLRFPIVLSVLLIYVGLLAVIVLAGLFIVPQLLGELQSLINNLPEYAGYLTGLLDRFADYPFVPQSREVEGALQDQAVSALGQVFSVAAFVIGLVADLLTSLVVLVIALFLVRDADRIINHFVGLLPEANQEQAREVVGEIGRKFYGWIAGTLLLSLAVGAMTIVGLYLVGMPYPVVLGVIAALFEFIPMIGPYLAAIPALAVGYSLSFQMVLIVAGLYILVQQIENNLLGPLVFSSQVHLPPLLAIVALLMGASLMGIIGALLAIPTAAALQVVWLRVVVPWVKGVERYWGAQ